LYDKDFDPVELAADLMVHRYVELSNILIILIMFLLKLRHFFFNDIFKYYYECS
jgi:hypothetical protein